jgi:uncharacterized membrane protein
MKFTFTPTLVATAVATLFSASAHAVLISAESAGQTTTTEVTGATVEDFNDSICGTYTSCVGAYKIFDTPSGAGQSAPPAGISSPYLSVPNPLQNGSVTLSLGTTANYFGLFWGSIDNYNTLTFLSGITEVASFTGTQVAAEIPGAASGNQTSDFSNRFFNFYFGDQLFDAVKLTSNGFAFETDNHTFATVSEPGTLALLALGLTSLVAVRRRKQA